MHSDFFSSIKTPGARSTERKLGSITELRGGGKGTEIQPEIAVPLQFHSLSSGYQPLSFLIQEFLQPLPLGFLHKGMAVLS